jgi:3-methyladenine DNA glycosylase/8-oxoguanine DNA glycosylase
MCWPSPKSFSQIPLHDLIGKGIDTKRARTMLALAKEWSFIGRPLAEDLNKLRLRLRQIVGIGEWTTNMILGFGSADLDAVPVGDLYLPSMVCSALAGDANGNDERMLELLECYRPYRFRVVRLLYSAHFNGLSKA